MELVSIRCDYCNEEFKRRASKHRYDIKAGRTTFFCSQGHANQFRRKELKACICHECSKPFSRPRTSSHDQLKYCGRPCSAKAAAKGRRGKQNKCLGCGKDCRRRKRCLECAAKVNSLQGVSIGDLRLKYDTNQFHAKIRSNARSVFKKNGGSTQCQFCKYDLQYDVAHLKPVSEYPPETMVEEVNRMSNLVPLCKRHHWEFDNGHLDVVDLQDT